MSLISDIFSDAGNPIELDDKTSLLKWGKYKILIIYPDISFKIFHIKAKKNKTYKFTVKGKDYILNPKAIVRGQRPLLVYYYNNPFPVIFVYESCQLTSEALYTEPQLAKMPANLKELVAKTSLDSETLKLLLNTNIMNGIYARGGLTSKTLIVFAVVGFVFLLIILQFTGVIDIISFISPTGG